MEKIEKILLLAVLGVALLIVGVMAFLPADIGQDPVEDRREGIKTGSLYDSMEDERTASLSRFDLGDENPVNEGPAAPGRIAGRVERDNAASQGEAIRRAVDAELDPGATGDVAAGEGSGERPGSARPVSERDGVFGSGEDTPIQQPSIGAEIALDEFQPHPTHKDYVVYRVNKGDVISRIAFEACGGGSRALDAILKVNEKLAINPDALQEGDEIMIPKALVLSRAERLRRRQERAATRSPGSGAASAIVPAGARTHVVQKNESLWAIAAKDVETRKVPAYIESIKKLNPQIKGNVIHLGERILLPAR